MDSNDENGDADVKLHLPGPKIEYFKVGLWSSGKVFSAEKLPY